MSDEGSPLPEPVSGFEFKRDRLRRKQGEEVPEKPLPKFENRGEARVRRHKEKRAEAERAASEKTRHVLLSEPAQNIHNKRIENTALKESGISFALTVPGFLCSPALGAACFVYGLGRFRRWMNPRSNISKHPEEGTSPPHYPGEESLAALVAGAFVGLSVFSLPPGWAIAAGALGGAALYYAGIRFSIGDLFRLKKR
jgi:hypothetical protein